MDIDILWTVRDWANAVANRPATGPLPRRTALVPHDRAAHALRRELIRAGHTPGLAGTRFVPTAFAAVELLEGADVEFTIGEERLRRVRMAAVLRSSIALRHFPLSLLRDCPGWDEALADTIDDLESAGLRPEDLEISSAPDRLFDLAALWRALDASAGSSWTLARAMLEAARVLEASPDAWPFAGATLAFARIGISAVEARLMCAIPSVSLGFAAARPLRDTHVGRLRALFGDAVAQAATSTAAPKTGGSERNLLASFFFEPPLVLASASRPRSSGPDGTVEIEEHAGVEEEVDAAVAWVARQIAAGIALEEIAILAPNPDPLTGLLANRLARLPWNVGRLPLYVEGGLPIASSSAGARALAVVRALGAHLSAGVLADVLPVMRCAGDARHLSRGAAMDLAWSLGTVGGNAAHPTGALEWSERAGAREVDLAAALDAARVAENIDGGAGRMARDIERLLADLRAIRPGLDALVALSRLLSDGAALDTLWPATREFLAAWVLQPGTGLNLGALLDETLAPIASDEACRGVTGQHALAVIEQAIVATRISSGRFGEPAVYIGTVAGAIGLEFTAVRVLDLSEGHLPSAVREDPVLPDRDRTEFAMASTAAAGLFTARDRALTQLHALDFVVRNASTHVALSAARLDITRSEREPSSVILEAAAAIGRPSRATGIHGVAIPDGTTLRRDFFVPARETGAAFRREHPLGEAAWQEGVSRRQFSPPPDWQARISTDLNRLDRLMHAAEAGALDGFLGSDALLVSVAGLTSERPISPSRLEALLGCPHAFLLQHVLGFDEPAAPPPQREIGQPFYGSLFHDVAAEFYRSCGASFCAQEGTLDGWLDHADAIVGGVFERFLLGYPLTGVAVRTQERERLRRDIRDLIQYDWSLAAPGRRFVAVERPFGRESPVELPLLSGDRPLFVRGRIDRIDAADQTTVVRDLKTGRAHRRVGKEAGPSAAIDLQIAIYGMVTRAHSSEWQIPSNIAAAYVYLSRGRSDERSYRDDFHQALEPAARGWLNLAGGLLASRLFPRTPHSDDCQYCAFRPVCGDRANERAASLLNPGAGDALTNTDEEAVRVLRAFAELKGLTASEGDGD